MQVKHIHTAVNSIGLYRMNENVTERRNEGPYVRDPRTHARTHLLFSEVRARIQTKTKVNPKEIQSEINPFLPKQK